MILPEPSVDQVVAASYRHTYGGPASRCSSRACFEEGCQVVFLRFRVNSRVNSGLTCRFLCRSLRRTRCMSYHVGCLTLYVMIALSLITSSQGVQLVGGLDSLDFPITSSHDPAVGLQVGSVFPLCLYVSPLTGLSRVRFREAGLSTGLEASAWMGFYAVDGDFSH